MKIRAALLVGWLMSLGVAGTACTGTRESARGGGRPSQAAMSGKTAIQAVYDFGMGFGTTRDELRDGLGLPDALEVEVAANRHDASATDSLFVIHYPGLRFSLNRPGPVGRDLLTEVVLTNGDRIVPGGLRVGKTTRAELDDALGAPTSAVSLADTVVLVHAVPTAGAEEYVQFYIVGGVVRRVRWIPYVD